MKHSQPSVFDTVILSDKEYEKRRKYTSAVFSPPIPDYDVQIMTSYRDMLDFKLRTRKEDKRRRLKGFERRAVTENAVGEWSSMSTYDGSDDLVMKVEGRQRIGWHFGFDWEHGLAVPTYRQQGCSLNGMAAHYTSPKVGKMLQDYADKPVEKEAIDSYSACGVLDTYAKTAFYIAQAETDLRKSGGTTASTFIAQALPVLQKAQEELEARFPGITAGVCRHMIKQSKKFNAKLN